MDLLIEVPGLPPLRVADPWRTDMIERVTGHKVSNKFASLVFATLSATMTGLAEHGEECEPVHDLQPDRESLSDKAVAWRTAYDLAIVDGVPRECLRGTLHTLDAMKLVCCPRDGLIGLAYPAGNPAAVAAYRRLWAAAVALHLATTTSRVDPSLN